MNATPPTSAALIVGCGYLGSRVATAWVASGRRVLALTRSRSAELAALGITPIVGDVLDPDSLKHLPEVGVVLYAVGLDRRAGRSMRDVYVNGLENVLKTVRCSGPILYVSSTGVYGQTDGEWVDETSETNPLEESGKVVLDAEAMLRTYRPDAMVLRFAGIYGPDRVLRKQALSNGEPLVGDAEKWLNLIHVHDGRDAVMAAEVNARPGETYLIADDEPVPRRAFYTEAAEILGAPPAAFVSSPTTAKEANRRIQNAKAKQELRFTPTLPTYREGLRHAIGESR